MIVEIWQSFRRMPGWVQVWVAVILVPVNLATLAFWAEPYGGWFFGLAVTGMAVNLPIMVIERGFSRTMCWPHVVIWTPLVVLLIWLLASGIELTSGYRNFLIVLLGVNMISLSFDYVDALKWLKGARDIA